MTVIASLSVLLGLIGYGMPIAFALCAVSIGILALGDVSMFVVIQRLYQGVNSFPLLAVPLFILAGQIMNYAGISTQLVDFAREMVGRMKGGLAAVNIITSMFFAGMSGTSMSDTAAVGGVLVPQMISRGYDRAFTAAVTASSSTIGIIIPPSVPMVLLAAYMGSSTGALFAAGMIPGILLGLGLIFAAWLISLRNDYPVEEKFALIRFLGSLLHALPALTIPAVLLGGILSGVFTPTEAAAVAVIYGIAVGFIWGTLTPRKLLTAIRESAFLTGVVMFVASAASALGYTFTYQQLAEELLGPLLTLATSSIGLLVLLSIVMIIVGTFLDGIAMMYIVVPLFLPAVAALDVDPIQFGMVVILCWGIGQQTPPVGAALFITALLAKVDIISITRANLWFIFVMIVVLALVIALPDYVVYPIPRMVGLMK